MSASALLGSILESVQSQLIVFELGVDLFDYLKSVVLLFELFDPLAKRLGSLSRLIIEIKLFEIHFWVNVPDHGLKPFLVILAAYFDLLKLQLEVLILINHFFVAHYGLEKGLPCWRWNLALSFSFSALALSS